MLETNVELQQHYPSVFFSMPIFVVQNSLVMYTCACAAVGPPYIIICFIHMYLIISYFSLFILVRLMDPQICLLMSDCVPFLLVVLKFVVYGLLV